MNVPTWDILTKYIFLPQPHTYYKIPIPLTPYFANMYELNVLPDESVQFVCFVYQCIGETDDGFVHKLVGAELK